MTGRCAVFTLQRDERFHLPLWARYYAKHFDPEDMYILNDGSRDPATLSTLAVFPGDVRHIEHDLVLDHEWMLQTVMAAQRQLLGSYEYVLFTDADEWLVPAAGTLREYIDQATAPAYRAIGYEVVEDRCFRAPDYDKTLLSREPLSWAYGYHHANPEPAPAGDLFLYHLHRLNFDEAWAKAQRWLAGKLDPVAVQAGHSVQNQISDMETFRQWFYGIPGSPEPLPERLTSELP